MGVDYELFERLVELSTRFRPSGRTLMLGRQSFKLKPRPFKKTHALLKEHRPDLVGAELSQEDGYAETLMRKLGFGEIETMDFSDYEGKVIIHDLNHPVPEVLEQQFDFIFDGGTIEHVFNIPQALENVFHMLKPGGRFVSANGFNGWPFHGIYQFSPELVWTFWNRNCGCEVHQCRGILKQPAGSTTFFEFRDPAMTGNRLKIRVPAGRLYLYYEVERLPVSALQNRVLQSDYETKWQGHGNAGETRLETTES